MCDPPWDECGAHHRLTTGDAKILNDRMSLNLGGRRYYQPGGARIHGSLPNGEIGTAPRRDQRFWVEIERHTGNNLVDGDFGEDVEGVILWWRDGDGDLTDALVDAQQDLVEGGSVWLMTPKVGRDNYVPGADVVEAAEVAGLSVTTTSSATADWAATRLTAHKR